MQQGVATMGHLTVTQAAERLGKSEKTIRRWIAEGRLHAHHPHGQPNLHAVAEDEIEHLATELIQYEQKQNARSLVERVNQIEQELRNYQLLNGTEYLTVGPVEIVLLENRLDALEQRIAATEQMLRVETPVPSDTKETTRTAEQKTSKKSGTGTPAEPSVELPNASVLIGEFAERHSVNPRTFYDQVTKGVRGKQVEATGRAKPGRLKGIERWLTPAQQGSAIAFWQNHGTAYAECSDCPHGYSDEVFAFLTKDQGEMTH